MEPTGVSSAPVAEAADREPRSWLTVVGIAVSVVSVAAVIVWALRQEAPRLPSSSSQIAALLAAIGIYAVATLLRGERWWRLMRKGGVGATRTDASALIAVGYMGNNVLPARGGDAMRVVLQAPRAGARMRDVLGSVVVERLLDLVTLLALFLILAYGLLRGVEGPDGGRLALVAAGAAILLLGGGSLLFLTRHRSWGRRLGGLLAPVGTAILALRGRHGAAMALMSACIWGLETLVYFAVGGSVGLGMDPLEAGYIVGLTSLFVVIPAGPGYVGTLDAAVIFGVEAIGGSGSEALSYMLMLRLVLSVPITIVGLVILLTRYGGWARISRLRRSRA